MIVPALLGHLRPRGWVDGDPGGSVERGTGYFKKVPAAGLRRARSMKNGEVTNA